MKHTAAKRSCAGGDRPLEAGHGAFGVSPLTLRIARMNRTNLTVDLLLLMVNCITPNVSSLKIHDWTGAGPIFPLIEEPMSTQSIETNSHAGVARHPSVVRAVATSVIGQILEWYDFFLYGTAAALVFGKAFFPIGTDPLTGTIAAYGGLALGFGARPLGGILSGHLGDRFGRKMVMTLTLTGMGVATFLMGLLPTYDRIGLWAPILLVALRLVQGLAAGGEWSGSILLISENVPASKRGRLAAWSPCGASIGFVLSTGVFMLMQQIAGSEFLSWGWRVPFLLSALLIGVGWYLRVHMDESVEFKESTKRAGAANAPLFEVLKSHPLAILQVFGLRFGEGGASWIFFAFTIAYGKFLGLSSSLVLGALTFSMAAIVPVSLFAGYLCDKLGRKPVYLTGSVGVLLFAWPFFEMLNTREPWMVVFALLIANSLILGILEGSQPALISELFPARLRYSGLGIGRELASVAGGGLAPMIATGLLAHFRSSWPIALYLGVLGLVTVITTCLTRETYPASERAADRAAEAQD
jgi:MFS family permease